MRHEYQVEGGEQPFPPTPVTPPPIVSASATDLLRRECTCPFDRLPATQDVGGGGSLVLPEQKPF